VPHVQDRAVDVEDDQQLILGILAAEAAVVGGRAAASNRSLIERYGSRVNERLPRVSAQKKLRVHHRLS
jgi:hypothetical protein